MVRDQQQALVRWWWGRLLFFVLFPRRSFPPLLRFLLLSSVCPNRKIWILIFNPTPPWLHGGTRIRPILQGVSIVSGGFFCLFCFACEWTSRRLNDDTKLVPHYWLVGPFVQQLMNFRPPPPPPKPGAHGPERDARAGGSCCSIKHFTQFA